MHWFYIKSLKNENAEEGKPMFSDVFGEGGDAGVRKKSSTWTLLLLRSIESQLTREEEKVGNLKIISPPKSFII